MHFALAVLLAVATSIIAKLLVERRNYPRLGNRVTVDLSEITEELREIKAEMIALHAEEPDEVIVIQEMPRDERGRFVSREGA